MAAPTTAQLPAGENSSALLWHTKLAQSDPYPQGGRQLPSLPQTLCSRCGTYLCILKYTHPCVSPLRTTFVFPACFLHFLLASSPSSNLSSEFNASGKLSMASCSYSLDQMTILHVPRASHVTSPGGLIQIM